MAGFGNGIPDDFIAHYTMDNISGTTLVDESENGNDGIMTAGVGISAGHIGNSTTYPANATDRTNLSAKPINNTDVYTISAWLMFSAAGYSGIYCSNLTGWAGHGIEFISLSSNILFTHARSDQIANNNSAQTPILADGNFHHYIAEREGTAIRLYQDDVLMDSATLVHNTLTNSANAYIGCYENGNTNTPQTVNVIDSIRIYDRILTKSEKTALFNE